MRSVYLIVALTFASLTVGYTVSYYFRLRKYGHNRNVANATKRKWIGEGVAHTILWTGLSLVVSFVAVFLISMIVWDSNTVKTETTVEEQRRLITSIPAEASEQVKNLYLKITKNKSGRYVFEFNNDTEEGKHTEKMSEDATKGETDKNRLLLLYHDDLPAGQAPYMTIEKTYSCSQAEEVNNPWIFSQNAAEEPKCSPKSDPMYEEWHFHVPQGTVSRAYSEDEA